MTATFGLDFGTTNSLATVIRFDDETGQLRPFTFTQDNKPHPSVVWYRGDKPIVGRMAKDQLHELGLGVLGDFVRSPKMFLGSPTDIYVGGVSRKAVDVVAEVLKHLRKDALERGYPGNTYESAVITIPVKMHGAARAELRQAAEKAGIRIHQFVHEPLAALYGYLRAQPDFRQELANLDRQQVLVFDWGGGTLDLTLCQLQNGVLTQIFNAGDTVVGGDEFDRRLRKLVRQKHEAQHPNADWKRMQPSAEARLIQACEDAKIMLSSRHTTTLYIQDFLAVAGPEKDLDIQVSKQELEGVVQDLIMQGLRTIETVLERAGLDRGAVEFCLATGGMVSMPAIREGLREMFGHNRLRLVENADTVISEGAAWIAHDGLGLQLAKPIELLHADNSYVEIIPTGTTLPFHGQSIQHRMDMYCVDPSDGYAKFLFARPTWPGRASHGYKREPYAHLTLSVDSHSQPLHERLQVEVTINHDLIAEVRARSSGRGQTRQESIQDLEFGLRVSDVVNAN